MSDPFTGKDPSLQQGDFFSNKKLNDHGNQDTDNDRDSRHHTLGTSPTQAAAGNHKHDDLYAVLNPPYFHGRVNGAQLQAVANLKDFTSEIDTHAGWNGVDLYTIPVTGIYRLTHSFKWNGTPAGIISNSFWSNINGKFSFSPDWFNHAFAGGVDVWSGRLIATEGIGVYLNAGVYTTWADTDENNYFTVEWVRPSV